MPDRTVVFTDLVDFSDLQINRHFGETTQQRTRRFADEVLIPHNSRIRECAREFAGADEGTWGDSFFLVFTSAVEAVQFAIRLLHSLRKEPIETIPGKYVQLHIGMHTGYVERFEGGYQGDSISTAARIISLAGTDHILLSDATRQLCGEVGGIKFIERGNFLLKGCGLAIVWEADWDGRGPRLLKKPPLSRDLEMPPLSPHFVGRAKELAEIDMSLDLHHALFVGGLSGIGKTSTLVQIILRRFRDGRLADNAFLFFDCSARDMRSEVAGELLLAQLGRFLAQIGADATAVAAACSESRSESDRLTAVGHGLASIPCLLLLDNFQDTLNEQRIVASQSLKRVLVFLLSRDLGSSRVVLASFEDWRAPDRVDVHPYELPDLEPADARLLLDSLHMRDEILVDRALEIVGGHPQALQWFSSLAREDHLAVSEVLDALTAVPRQQFTEREFHERLAAELLDRIWRRLSQASRELLLAGVIFREPPSFAALQAAAGLDDLPARQARQQLLSFYLVQTQSLEAPHSFHPLVREYGRVKGAKVIHLIHHRAAAWWRAAAGDPPEPIAGIEAHYHFLGAGDFEEASELAKKVLTVLEEAGEAAWEGGLLAQARHFDQWQVVQEPNNPDAHRYLAQTLARLRDPRAEVHFKRGLELAPQSPKLLTEYGRFLDQRGMPAEAEAKFIAGIDAAPKDPVLRTEYARFLDRQGKPQEAEGQFRIGLEADPKNVVLRSQYGRFLYRHGKLQQAEEQFRAGIEADPQNAVLCNEYAQFLDRQDKLQQAEEQFRSGIQIDPKMPHLRTEFARFLNRQGRLVEAEMQFRVGIEANPKDAALRNECARFLDRQERPAEAEVQFRAGIEANPKGAALRNEYARFLDRQRRLAEAEVQFRAGIEANPKEAALRNEYARFLDRQERLPEAEEQFVVGIGASPKALALRNEYARFLDRQGRPAEAEVQFRAGIEVNSKEAVIRNEYARFLDRQERPAEAEEQFRAGIEANPKKVALRNGYARFLDRQGRPAEAEVQFRAGIEANPKEAALRNEYARFLDRQERPAEAEEQFRAGIEANPKKVALRNGYARFLDRQGRLAEAEVQFRTGIEAEPKSGTLRVQYGRFLDRQRKPEQAEEQFHIGIEADPKNPVLRNEFARFLIRQMRYSDASDQVLAGLASEPANTFLLRTKQTLSQRE